MTDDTGLIANIMLGRGHYGEDGFVFGVGGLSLLLILVLLILFRRSIFQNIVSIIVLSASASIIIYFSLVLLYYTMKNGLLLDFELVRAVLFFPFLFPILPTSVFFLFMSIWKIRNRQKMEGGLAIGWLCFFLLFSLWHLIVAYDPQYIT